MTSIIFIAAAIAAATAQFSIFPVFFSEGFRPELLVFLVVYLGLRTPIRRGAPAAFLIGLIQDCYSGIYFGLHGVTSLLIYYTLRHLAGRLYTTNHLLIVLCTFLASIVQGGLTMLFLLLFSLNEGVHSTIIATVIQEAAVNAVAASILLMLVDRRQVEPA